MICIQKSPVQKPLPIIMCIVVVTVVVTLAACTRSTGPAVIRDAVPPGAGQKTARQPESTGESVAMLQPPVPGQQPAAIPLVEQLIRRANQELDNHNFERAIADAEHGLRINRREPRLYLVLAKAYEQLANQKQSTHFARQGLRYAARDSDSYRSLEALAR